MPENSVDDLKLHPRVLEIYQQRVRLRKDGKEYVGLCPLHSEKTPSFHVHLHEGVWMWNCFGCDSTGGNVLQFVQKMDGISFKEAVGVVRGQLSEWSQNKSLAESTFRPLGIPDEKPKKTYTLRKSRKQPAVQNVLITGGLSWIVRLSTS